MPEPDAAWESRARRAESHLAALDAAVRGIAGVLDLERVLQVIVDRVRELAGARYAALGIAGTDGRLVQFITSGMSAARRARIGGLPEGHGLLGLIIREGTTFRLADVETDPRSAGVPPHHPPIHTFLGVPIRVRGSSVGNLYLANKRSAAAGFNPDDQRLVEQFALHAGLAIETARLHDREARLAVVEERDRIGRDLHDGVIQRLYGVTLQLEDVPDLLAEAPDEAAARVDRAIDAIQAAIGDIRDFIYGLSTGFAGPGDLGVAVEDLADEIAVASGLEIVVVADAVELPEPRRAEVLAIVREALSNVVRHSGARSARVAVRQSKRTLEIAVSDDGAGFLVRRAAPDHHGLANMQRRAVGLGGKLAIESALGAGTRIIVRVPVTSTDSAARP